MIAASELDTLWNYADPEASEARFREQLIEATGHDAAEYQTQIARTFSLRGRIDEAHALLDSLEAGIEEASARARTRYHLERGRAFRSGGEPAQAIPHFEAAYTHAQAAENDTLTIDAAHMLGITEGADASWHQRALDLARTTPDERARRWLPSLLNNYAWSLHDGGRLDEALAVFQEAERVFEANGHERRLQIARYSVARCMRSMGRVDEAWAIQHALVDGNDGYVFEELGELALLKGEPASPWFARAFELLKDDRNLAKEPARLARMKSLGEG